MFQSTLYEEKQVLQFKMPWHKNTAKAFAICAPIVLLLVLLIGSFRDIRVDERPTKSNLIPITILNFGDGDGTGLSSGNLTERGAMHKGNTPPSSLHDAETSAQTKATTNPASTDITQSSNLVPTNTLPSDKNNTNNGGSDARNTGSPNGSPDGQGLSYAGSGRGAGLGFGDIDWGGGGNRIVLNKKIPVFPPGVNTSAQIKIRFIVKPDGTVSQMIPLQKADPRLEKAAMDALRQWRFNPLKENKEMVGIIPFTFRLR